MTKSHVINTLPTTAEFNAAVADAERALCAVQDMTPELTDEVRNIFLGMLTANISLDIISRLAAVLYELCNLGIEDGDDTFCSANRCEQMVASCKWCSSDRWHAFHGVQKVIPVLF